MALFVMIGRDGPRGAELRQRVRSAHLAHIEPLAEAGRIVYAGPLLDADAAPNGSVIVFEAGDLAAARAIVARDPYVAMGVFESHEVIETRRVFPA